MFIVSKQQTILYSENVQGAGICLDPFCPNEGKRKRKNPTTLFWSGTKKSVQHRSHLGTHLMLLIIAQGTVRQRKGRSENTHPTIFYFPTTYIGGFRLRIFQWLEWFIKALCSNHRVVTCHVMAYSSCEKFTPATWRYWRKIF